ncbi:MAG TPA: PqqD family protein, partial [Candidatus Methanoperedens sp.]
MGAEPLPIMVKYYRLTSGTMIEYQDGELVVINVETGFAATGNKYAYEILQLMDAPITIKDIIEEICKKYPESQHSRVIKSVPSVIQWAIERGIGEEVPSP